MPESSSLPTYFPQSLSVCSTLQTLDLWLLSVQTQLSINNEQYTIQVKPISIRIYIVIVAVLQKGVARLQCCRKSLQEVYGKIVMEMKKVNEYPAAIRVQAVVMVGEELSKEIVQHLYRCLREQYYAVEMEGMMECFKQQYLHMQKMAAKRLESLRVKTLSQAIINIVNLIKEFEEWKQSILELKKEQVKAMYEKVVGRIKEKELVIRIANRERKTMAITLKG